MLIRRILIAFLMVFSVAAYGADALLFEDKFDTQSLGKASGVTFEDGKAVFDAPGDTIEYPAEVFAGPAGRIEFDVKLTKPLDVERPIWCLLSDIGAGGSHWGAINVHWRDKPAYFEFGIFDGSAHNWCIAKDIDWSVWRHVTLVYGPTGMRLEIDGKLADRNDYKGGLANTSKRIGWDDPWNDSPPCMVDNLKTSRTNVDRLAVSGPVITPNDDGLLDTCTITYGIESASTVTLTVSDRFGEPIATLVDGKKLPAGEYTIAWDGKSAEDGVHTITMRADVRQLTQKITVDRRWKWKKPKPAFDNFFPLGTWYFWEDDASYIDRYTADPTKVKEYYERTMKDLADHGFNLIVAVWTPHDHRRMQLDVAQKYGIKVLVHLDEINTVVSSGVLPKGENIFQVAENAIKDVKNHPAVAGYYMIDEPNNSPEIAKRILEAKQALETVDPKHPGFSCLLGGYEELLKTVDYQVLMVDIYPLHPAWSGDWSGYISELERGVRYQGDRPLWVILQAFGKPNNAWKIPTAEEIRAQVWLALAHGAKGILYFIYQSTTGFQGEWLQGLVDMKLQPMDGRLDEVGRIDAQIKTLAPILLKLKPSEFTLPVVPDQVLAKGFADPKGAKYVILANKDVKSEVVIAWTSTGAVDVLTKAKIDGSVKLPPGGGIVIRL